MSGPMPPGKKTSWKEINGILLSLEISEPEPPIARTRKRNMEERKKKIITSSSPV